ncbi:4-carboxymuconolactone decarboxylase [Advenella sp. S44]|uniref:Carboxymuconolactone decarboxylase family protein n=1 Tax=Advenella kashmirensis TaxID=310575 RepID=A0A356LAW1_9BURK|nr:MULTISPECIES: carboxymuconolactone decarboxylase family protein [unclassified Advenella]PJX20313.1 4-carboxymuconolactone decarboxylase [Advenella sp. S44]HBP28127.1 carboxymuconolactone decarboxylase family protein [Advenella kashmirensis]
MQRLPMLDPSEMSAEQAAACEAARTGPRGKIPAPMIAWLRNPELARRAQDLGALLRFDTSLTPRLTELAILVCARHWTSHHEWTAHKKLALQAGLEPATIDAIADHRAPAFTEVNEKIVYVISREVLSSGQLSPTHYTEGIQALGERGLVELVAILGYYCLVSITLNCFEIGLPESRASELERPDSSEAGVQP